MTKTRPTDAQMEAAAQRLRQWGWTCVPPERPLLREITTSFGARYYVGQSYGQPASAELRALWEEVGLTNRRALNTLMRNGLTPQQVREASDGELLLLRNLGATGLAEVRAALRNTP